MTLIAAASSRAFMFAPRGISRSSHTGAAVLSDLIDVAPYQAQGDVGMPQTAGGTESAVTIEAKIQHDWHGQAERS